MSVNEKEFNKVSNSIKKKGILGYTDSSPMDILHQLDETLDSICIGMDIPMELQNLLDKNESIVTKDMSNEELKAYKFGISTAISLLSALVDNDEDVLVFQKPTEVIEETTLGDIVGFFFDYNQQ